MKKFILLEILLLSTTEKKAKKVRLNEKRTIIFGSNDTGKSSLIKSIYKTFGATPAKEHPAWKSLNPISFVKFKIDSIQYSILKDGKIYALFNKNDELIYISQSVTNDLGPILANLLDFKIKLPNKNNELITPPPAFLFLPYYIDQDQSWQNNWSGFSNLQQLKNYREPIVSYHTGLKPNEYYISKGEIEQYVEEIKILEEEKKLSKNILEGIKEKLSQLDFNFSMEDFKEEIKNLLIECEELKKVQDKLKSKLVDLYNLKAVVDSQIVITKNALNETRKDYEYVVEVEVEDHVDCPTCGAHYENSFSERFEIAKDEDRCKTLISELTRELEEVDSKIRKENEKYNKNNEEIVKIEAILEKKKGDIKLKDVIENAGKNELKKVFEENSKILQEKIIENATKKKDLDDKLKRLTNKERRDSILNEYHFYMKKYLSELEVFSLKEDTYKRIDSKIPETGSSLPRALIAYYFSLFQVIKKYTSSAFCPIIIDSPNQQAQDLGHVDKILKFINQNQPNDSQMILGLEELYNVDFNCEIIELKEKRSLLQRDEYENVRAIIDPFLMKIWNSDKSFLL